MKNNNQTISLSATDLQMRLSPHFTLAEMVRSGTAIRLGIINIPKNQETLDNLTQLCRNPLEQLRCRFGRICVTSGYRCAKLNRAVGGKPTSQHLRGEAADIYVSGSEMARRYAEFMRRYGQFDQLIVEPRGAKVPRWIHISYTVNRPLRKQILN